MEVETVKWNDDPAELSAAWEQDDGAAEKPWRPLPLAVEDLSAEWLTAALSRDVPGLLVNGFEVTKVKHGFTSIIHVRVDMNDIGRKSRVPSTIIVKGGFTPHSRHYAPAYCMEAQSYRDIWPVLNLKMPETYFIDMDLEARQAIIIMEDLNARGVKFGHGLRPIGYDTMSQRLSMLAALHAQTWGSPDLKPGGKWDGVLLNGARLTRTNLERNGWIVPSGDDFVQEPAFFTPEGWETLWADRISQNAAVSYHFHDREWTQKAIAYLEALADELPNCIVHGDTHLANHFEEADGTPGFFDSMPRREPAYIELAYTIVTGLDPYDRRKWERSLIGHYVDELARHGVKIDFDETVHYYSLFMFVGYLWFIVNDTVWQYASFNTVHLWRFSSAMMDNGTKEFFDVALADKG